MAAMKLANGATELAAFTRLLPDPREEPPHLVREAVGVSVGADIERHARWQLRGARELNDELAPAPVCDGARVPRRSADELQIPSLELDAAAPVVIVVVDAHERARRSRKLRRMGRPFGRLERGLKCFITFEDFLLVRLRRDS